jgi:hypothetical protein
MTNSIAPSLLACTEDPGAACTDAVPRPKPGDGPLRWYRDTKPRFYRPYLIRVVKRTDNMMVFVFLNSTTGADLALSKPTYEIAYHDGRYAYSALPSTAHRAEPGSARSCGLLFMSDLYMESLPESDRLAIAAVGDDEHKWPLSASKYTGLITRLQTELSGRLSSQDESDLASMLQLLQRVA